MSTIEFTGTASGDVATPTTGKGLFYMEESSKNPFFRDDTGLDTPMKPGGVNISHQLLLDASSFSDQIPTGLDVTTQVEFGAAQGSVSDPVMIDASGTVTINEDLDSITLGLLVSFGRSGGAGVSEVFFRSIVTIGATVIFSTPIFVKIDNANSQQATFVVSNLAFPAGTTIEIQFVRDPAGNDSGSLLSQTPTATGWGAGFGGDSVSANILITQTVAT